MPLSDDEQRILLEIEKEFYDSDPILAREVGEASLYKHSLRNIKWAVCIGVFGLVGVVASLQIHFAAAFASFLIMFVCTVVVERNLRKMGKAGLRKVSGSVKSGQVRQNMGGLGEKIRNRLKREG